MHIEQDRITMSYPSSRFCEDAIDSYGGSRFLLVFVYSLALCCFAKLRGNNDPTICFHKTMMTLSVLYFVAFGCVIGLFPFPTGCYDKDRLYINFIPVGSPSGFNSFLAWLFLVMNGFIAYGSIKELKSAYSEHEAVPSQDSNDSFYDHESGETWAGAEMNTRMT